MLMLHVLKSLFVMVFLHYNTNCSLAICSCRCMLLDHQQWMIVHLQMQFRQYQLIGHYNPNSKTVCKQFWFEFHQSQISSTFWTLCLKMNIYFVKNRAEKYQGVFFWKKISVQLILDRHKCEIPKKNPQNRFEIKLGGFVF